MGYNDCKKHDWKIHASSQNTYAGHHPAIYMCDKCQLTMSASDVHQLRALENQSESLRRQADSANFMKKYYVFTIIISAVALILSVFNLFK